MSRTLRQIAEFVKGRVIGDDQVEISGVASVAGGGSQDLVFAENETSLTNALGSSAAAVVANEASSETKSSKPLLIAEHPRLAFSRAASFLNPRINPTGAIHPAAVVHPDSVLGRNVDVGPHAVILEHCVIGEGTKIGAGCVIGPHVSVGQDCDVYPNVTIYPQTKLGDRVILHAGVVLGGDGFGYVRDPHTGKHEKFPQIGRLELGDDVEIGANSTVDRGALETTGIGCGTKIDNLVHIGHNSQIGENVVIAAQTGISGSVIVEDDVVMGGQVGLGDHVRVQRGVILGAQTGVPSNKIVRGKGVIFWGTPARPLSGYLKELATLARLSKKK